MLCAPACGKRMPRLQLRTTALILLASCMQDSDVCVNGCWVLGHPIPLLWACHIPFIINVSGLSGWQACIQASAISQNIARLNHSWSGHEKKPVWTKWIRGVSLLLTTFSCQNAILLLLCHAASTPSNSVAMTLLNQQHIPSSEARGCS